MGNTLADVPTEKAVTKRIRDYLLTLKQCVPYKQHGSAFSLPGTPDFLLCYRGLFVAIEVKRPHSASKVSAAQKTQLDRINAAGGYAIVARSKEDVMRLINHIDKQLIGGDTVWCPEEIRGY